MNLKYIVFASLIFLLTLPLKAQVPLGNDIPEIDYANPKDYEIGGITVSGVQNLDNNVIIVLSGLTVGQKIKIPGEEVTNAIDKLWEQGLFENIRITITKVIENNVFLDIYLSDKPRLSKFSFTGIKKGEADDIRKEIKLIRGDIVTQNLLLRTKNAILKFFIDKGFLNSEVDIVQKKDTTITNAVDLVINIKKNGKVRINNIHFFGNNHISSMRLRSSMKETKERMKVSPPDHVAKLIWDSFLSLFRKDSIDMFDVWQKYLTDRISLTLFKGSKLIKDDYEADKLKVIEKYNDLGYRDATVIKDSIYSYDKKSINIDIYLNEGRKYFFRNITWLGNSKYSSAELNSLMKIKKGDVYSQKALDENLAFNPNGSDVSSLYLDDGYLFFQANPVEVAVENDSIDVEIRIQEGKQARINKIIIKGNTKTNDNVIYRELKTKPGQLFSRADIIRTQRELAQLKYFDPEKLGVNPIPNPVDGTVDIEYTVEETSNDQLELSGGWGGGRVIGTLGVSFNNFSTKNFFKKSAWRPLPSGDGQKLSVRFQTNGQYYQSYNASFTEPWLGGKKPISFSTSVYYSVFSNTATDGTTGKLKIAGVSLSLAKRLNWPDDYFILEHGLSFQNYSLDKYSGVFSFSDGYSNNISYSISLSRNSIDAPIYPRHGSEISLSLQITPPYSAFQNKNYNTISDQEKYKWIEYHKWNFKASWFFNIIDKLVLNTRVRFGYLGFYNSDLGVSPFERYYLGGDGLSGYSMDGREIVALRGYGNYMLTPGYPNSVGASVFNKYTLELRYPVSLNPSATIYLLGFAEAGNSWAGFNKFNPFNVYKSAGIGVRIFLPMFGLLGFDYGWGFDEIPGYHGRNKGEFHFSINQSID